MLEFEIGHSAPRRYRSDVCQKHRKTKEKAIFIVLWNAVNDRWQFKRKRWPVNVRYSFEDETGEQAK